MVIFESKAVDIERELKLPSSYLDLIEEKFCSIASSAKPWDGPKPTVALPHVPGDPCLLESKSDGFGRSH